MRYGLVVLSTGFDIDQDLHVAIQTVKQGSKPPQPAGRVPFGSIKKPDLAPVEHSDILSAAEQQRRLSDAQSDRQFQPTSLPAPPDPPRAVAEHQRIAQPI